jgi:hypothetical protein
VPPTAEDTIGPYAYTIPVPSFTRQISEKLEKEALSGKLWSVVVLQPYKE